jgi:4a-hydroxytetrahydrobiopterin dehydratase
MDKCTEEDIQAKLEAMNGWSRKDSKWIVKKYRFPEFLQGIAFVNEVARIAEQMNHHPMIAVDYRLVTLSLSSWHAGGLTELDFTSAARYDEAFAELAAQP